MKIQLFTNFEELKSSRDQWDRLAGTFPFHRWAWLGNWFECLATDGTPAVLVGIENEQWIGIAPFWLNECSGKQRRLRFWGDGKACTDYMGLIAKPTNVEAFTFAVVDWLTKECVSGGKLGDLDLIELGGLSENCVSACLLTKVLEANGFVSHTAELEGCWVADLPDNWAQLNAGFSKSMRRKTKKAVQRLADDACEIRSSLQDDFDSLWTTFVDLHQKRRAMLDEAGCFADPAFEAFLRKSSQELIEEGRAELVVIEFEGQPLASMLLMNDESTNYMYQSGADETRMKLEPGYQIAVTAIQKSIDYGLKHFDFMRGDEPYKARWSTTRVAMHSTRFIPRKLGAQVKHNIWLTGQAIKNCLRTK